MAAWKLVSTILALLYRRTPPTRAPASVPKSTVAAGRSSAVACGASPPPAASPNNKTVASVGLLHRLPRAVAVQGARRQLQAPRPAERSQLQ